MSFEHKYASPDGAFHFCIVPWEARMSHWIETPELIDSSGASLLRFKDSNWSLDQATWLDPSTVTLNLRKYPGDHLPGGFEVTIDCRTKTATLASRTVPLRCLEKELQKLYKQSKKVARSREKGASGSSAWRQWLTTLWSAFRR